MPDLIDKVILKVLRVLKIKGSRKIKKGILQGYKWKIEIPDSRYLLGTYEVALSKYVKKAVSEGNRLIDIGANAGYFSLIAGKYGRADLKHVAVEPVPENIRLLKSHLSENDIQNVIIEPMAISDKEGEIEFSNSSNLAANTYKTESSIFSEETIKVKTSSLDAFASKYQLDSNCLIKIDVEGAELDVLKGGASFLRKFHPELVLATHDNHIPGIKNACLEFLQKLGYRVETLEDEKIEGQEDFICIYRDEKE